MSEYLAAAFALGIGMFYLLYVSFNLTEQYAPLKLFLLGVSFWMGAILINFGAETVNNVGLHSFVEPAYYLWIVSSIVVFSYMVLLMIIKGYNAIQSKKNKVIFDDEQ